MSEKFLAEKKRFKDNWIRVSRILYTYREQYDGKNKNDILEDALDLLEAKLKAENK